MNIIDFVFLTFPFYYDSYDIMGTFMMFYIFINVLIAAMGSFLILGGLDNTRTFLGIDKKELYKVPIISTAILEKNE